MPIPRELANRYFDISLSLSRAWALELRQQQEVGTQPHLTQQDFERAKLLCGVAILEAHDLMKVKEIKAKGNADWREHCAIKIARDSVAHFDGDVSRLNSVNGLYDDALIWMTDNLQNSRWRRFFAVERGIDEEDVQGSDAPFELNGDSVVVASGCALMIKLLLARTVIAARE